MKLHCIVEDVETARVAAEGGATVIQLRLKDIPTLAVVEAGRPIAALCKQAKVTFVVNDDVEAALALNAEGVHLGRGDNGKELARAAGLVLGISAPDRSGRRRRRRTQPRRSGSTGSRRFAKR